MTATNIGYLSYKIWGAPSSIATMMMRSSRQSISPTADGVRRNKSSVLRIPYSFSRKSLTIFLRSRYRASDIIRYSRIHPPISPAFTAAAKDLFETNMPFPAHQFQKSSIPSPSSPIHITAI